MKAVIQRVQRASVSIEGQKIASIDKGAVVLLGVAKDDTLEDMRWLANKTAQLRIYDDEKGMMNCSMQEIGGSFLVVSQFTLYADCRKGNRPGFTDAARPIEAERLYEAFVQHLRDLGHKVQTGRFRATMVVSLENNGPVTIVIESPKKKENPQ